MVDRLSAYFMFFIFVSILLVLAGSDESRQKIGATKRHVRVHKK